MPGAAKKSKKKTPKPTQEELDEQRLREIEARLKELTQLMSEGKDRPRADEHLTRARQIHAEHSGNHKERVFYKTQGAQRPVTVSQHTRSHLELADALKLRIRLGEFALDLGDSMQRLAEEQVEVLERVLKRARY
jgi:hypothetical protein